MATVVLKLFSIVGPDLAFFGAKDYQQLRVIRRMVADLDLPVEIRPVATVREPDGLAMSSRNRYLDPDHRRAAVVLSRALAAAAEAVRAGERDADRVRQILRETIGSEPLATARLRRGGRRRDAWNRPSRSARAIRRWPCWPRGSARPG